MRTSLSLSFLIAAVGTLAGCSDSGDKCPPGDTSAACTGGSAQGGSGGQVGGGQGGGSSGTAGSAGGGQGGSTGSSVNRGTLFDLEPATGSATALPFRIAGPEIGIQGSSFIDISPQGTTFAVIAGAPGEICVQGTLGVVPSPAAYGTHWGVDFGFNLNQATTAVGGGGDAGAVDGGAGDAGAAPDPGALPPLAWIPPANVLGFSFVVTGGTTGKLRVRVRPYGLDPAAESSIYCKDIPAAFKDVPTDVLLTEVRQQCWNPTSPVAPKEMGFDRISWNLPADVIGTQPAPVDFNFCIKDIRPILAP